MAKQSGLSMAFYLSGFDLSGDTRSLDTVSGSIQTLEVTDITQSAFARLGGLRAGVIDWTSYFDPAAGASHAALSPLPTTDVIASVLINPLAIGSPVCSCNGLQIGYDPTRAANGELTLKVHIESDKYGLEWGTQLTAGKRTDTAATNGASNDFLAASASFGAQAYLQAFAFTGTDVTVVLQDSADNASFANVTGGSFAQITGGTPAAQRIATANNLQIRRYVRAITTTVGGFTSFTFAVQISVNAVSVVF